MVAQSAADSENARVIVFCDRHTILAELKIGRRRLSDVVNDPLHNVFHFENVKISPSDRMDENLAEYESAAVKREAVHALMVMVEPPYPPGQRISNYLPKQPTRVAALLPSFHVVGSLYLAAKRDARGYLMDDAEAFAVLKDAIVTFTSRSDKPICVTTALLNRAHIELAAEL